MQNDKLPHETVLKNKIDNVYKALDIKPRTFRILTVLMKMVMMKNSGIFLLRLPLCSSLQIFFCPFWVFVVVVVIVFLIFKILAVASHLAARCLFLVLCIRFQREQCISVFFPCKVPSFSFPSWRSVISFLHTPSPSLWAQSMLSLCFS